MKSSNNIDVIYTLFLFYISILNLLDAGEEWEEAKGICSPGQHQWRHRVCMVCTVCRECTGYSISCLSSILPDRNPGQ